MSSPLFDGLAPLGPDDAANECILRVALPVPLDQLFDYRLPARLSAAHTDLSAAHPGVRPGTRVRIPFAGQLLVGLVVPNDLMTDERDEPLEQLNARDGHEKTDAGDDRQRGSDELARRRLRVERRELRRVGDDGHTPEHERPERDRQRDFEEQRREEVKEIQW